MYIQTFYNVQVADNSYKVKCLVSEIDDLPDDFDINNDEQIIDLVIEIHDNKCKSSLEQVTITTPHPCNFNILDENGNKTRFILQKFKKSNRSLKFDYKLTRPRD